jgi:hypothetical protein
MQREIVTLYFGRRLSIMYCSVLPYILTEDGMHINFAGTVFFRKEYNVTQQVLKAVSTRKFKLHSTETDTHNYIEKCPPISLPDKVLAHTIHGFIEL